MRNTIIALSVLVLGSLGCDAYPLRIAHGTDAGIVSVKTDAAPFVRSDASFAPDLAPVAPDALVLADTLSAKPDVQIAVDALVVKTDVQLAPDLAPLVPDAFIPTDTLPAKNDAFVSPDTRLNPDTQIVKMDGQGTTDVQIATSGTVYMSIAIDNPAGMTMYNNTEKVNLLKVTVFGNGLVTSATFRRLGVGQVSDWGNLYLYDSDTLLMSGSISSATNEVTFPGLLFRVNGPKSLILRGDLRAAAVAGDTHYFSLDSADKVVSDAMVSGTFPIVGNTFTVSGLQRPEATDASPLPDAQPTPDTQITKTDLAPVKIDAGGSTDVIVSTDAVVQNDTRPDEYLTINVHFSDVQFSDKNFASRIITANTSDNAVLSIDFDGVSEPVLVQAVSFYVSGANVGSLRSAIRSVRIFDASGTLFCSGEIVLGWRGDWLDCTNYAGLFTINGKTTITAKVSVGQVYPPENNSAVSGDTFSVGLNINANLTSPGHGYFLAVGTVSGKKYMTGGYSNNPAVGFIPVSTQIIGSSMVVYKSQPTVATIAGGQTLMNGEISLYKLSVTAATNGDVGLKQFMTTSLFHEIGSIGSARFLVNGIQYDNALIGVPGGVDGVDLGSGTISSPSASVGVVVAFNSEVTISEGTTKTFELRAVATGVLPGSSISSNIGADPYDSTIGTLDAHPFSYFLWSDCSDGCTASSADWIGGQLVSTFPTTPTFLTL